jgi:UDP-glucose 4-epimerase
MSLADVSLAGEVLDYAPEVGFETGLERTVAWFAEGAAGAATSLEPTARSAR